MDLKRLTHLLALADERHFGRAAERVHLSQPALSRSIQALESETGQRRQGNF
jgi:DNA-binding transcriptional LysR family regulator